MNPSEIRSSKLACMRKAVAHRESAIMYFLYPNEIQQKNHHTSPSAGIEGCSMVENGAVAIDVG